MTILNTPAEDGFHMPAEWEPHAGCLMAWPTRRELWRERFEAARIDYAQVARAIADFEPLTMVCNPGDEAEVRNYCGAAIEALPIPINDSWMRDMGPIFVRNQAGEIAAVDFTFNAWGNRWHPHDDDAAVARRISEHLGVRRYVAPMVLEGGAVHVDGDGTLLTTEQCLLNPNRNPDLTQGEIEQYLKDYLGVTSVIWLDKGHSLDVGPAGTDGHIDGVAAFVSSGHVLLEVTRDPSDAEYVGAHINLDRLASARDAHGRTPQVSILDPGTNAGVSYANFYLANGAVIVPVDGGPADEQALATIAAAYPDRTVVGVPGATLAFGGGGPHCITQQIPAGPFAAPSSQESPS
jgi:agmatine deiminase